MTPSTNSKLMLKADELKYLEDQMKQTISSIEHSHFQYYMSESNGIEYDDEYPGWTKSWLKMRLEDLYFLIIAYLEGRDMLQFLETFKSKFKEQIANETDLLETTQTHPEGEGELKIIVGFKQFLEPFKFFDSRQLKEDENLKLESILRNTGFILKNIKTVIKKEADIYNEVKWILGLYYPSTRRKNKAAFIEEFKSYNPDILIPELKVAIEYKYIDSPSDNIDEFIDQLKVDATNYVDDYKYDTFYAVIYIEDISIATPESIEVAWKSKRFPNNWNLVLSGHSIKAVDKVA